VSAATPAPCSYVVPFRQIATDAGTLATLANDFRRLGSRCEIVVADGSPPADFARHDAAWGRLCRHVPLDPRWRFANGKVNGVLTGIDAASHEYVVLADDDVVHERADVDRLCALLAEADLVVPQNYFRPLPWWARVETARMLVNRAIRPAGDYPGTYALRRSVLRRIGPYDGDVLFENEAMRLHFARHGARVVHARNLMIARRPPTFAKWREQRVRQAYEDLDLRSKTAIFAALLPAGGLVGVTLGAGATAAYAATVAATAIALAAVGRDGAAASVIPASTSLAAPLWVLERAVSVHRAAWARLVRGGCRYGDRLIATPSDARRAIVPSPPPSAPTRSGS
jgi:hypothetical protein